MFSLDISSAESKFNAIFDNVNGKLVNAEAREINDNDETYGDIYGEAKFSTVEDILKDDVILSNKHRKSVLDIGSGIGNFLIAAAYLDMFEEYHGVELLKGLYDKSVELVGQTDDDTKSRIKLFNEDIFNFDVSKYDFIYANYPVKIGELKDKFEDYVTENATTGTILMYNIGIFKENNSRKWELLKTKPTTFAWGTTTFRYYRKN